MEDHNFMENLANKNLNNKDLPLVNNKDLALIILNKIRNRDENKQLEILTRAVEILIEEINKTEFGKN